MSEPILHHYPQSPVSEKVRVVLGMKDLDWRSVEIPRLPPKPDLMPLTGGYRRTPVLQIGADIFCDSQCIMRELERRYPEPTLYPNNGAGMVWGVSRWTDGPLFETTIAVVLGAQADTLPEDFARDRGRLYFGPDYDLGRLQRDLPHLLAQLRGQLGWMEARLATDRRFMLGDAPGLPDALCYYLVWFIRGRYEGGAELLGEFPNLLAWEERVRGIGHGRPRDMTSSEALDVARAATPEPALGEDPHDPQRLSTGQEVSVVPDVDGGDPAVTGRLVGASADEVAITREDPRAGEVVVHFPRVGYRVQTL